MKPERVVQALYDCKKLIEAPMWNDALFHAVNFAGFGGQTNMFNRFIRPGSFLSVLEISPSQPASQVSSDLIGPTEEEVRGHVVWMFEKIPALGSKKKQCRWISFGVGAFVPDMLWALAYSDEATLSGFDSLLAVAENSASPYHLEAHLVLGHLQGNIWRKGLASINNLRLMNNPELAAA